MKKLNKSSFHLRHSSLSRFPVICFFLFSTGVSFASGGVKKVSSVDRTSNLTHIAIVAAYAKGNLIPFTLELIRSAKTTDELLARTQQIQKLQTLHAVCEEELRFDKRPYHCYRVIEVERTIGFLRPDSARQTLQFLDQLCLAPASDSHRLKESTGLTAEEKVALSAGCLRILIAAEKRTLYVQEESQPVNRFSERFEKTTDTGLGHLAPRPHLALKPRALRPPEPIRAVTNILK